MKLQDVIHFMEDEDILILTRSHWIRLVIPLLVSLILIVVPFFFLFPLFKSGPTGILMFLVLIGSGIYVGIRTIVMWDATLLIVTSFRFVYIEQLGLFTRKVYEVVSDNVFDAYFDQQGLGTMFDYGTITCTSGNPIVAKFIPNPKEVHKTLNMITHDAKANTRPAQEDKSMRLKRLKDKLDDLSEEELHQIEHNLNDDERTSTLKELYDEEEDMTKLDAPSGFKHVKPKEKNEE